MGLSVPQTIDGESIKHLLVSPEVNVNRKVFFEFGRFGNINDSLGGFQPLRGVFDGRYKLIINLLDSDELYDLQNDPNEMKNLIADANTACVRDQLHDELLQWMDKTRDPFRGYHWQQRPWRNNLSEPSWQWSNKRRYRASDPDEPTQLDFQNGKSVPQDQGHYPVL